MKKKNLFSLAFMLMAAAMLSFTSCDKEEDDDDNNPDPIPEGIIGNWISEGENVAPLLVQFFDVTRITAQFNEDGSYEVKSYTSENVETLYTGVFTQTESGVGEVWNIELIQSVPTGVTSEGIFEVTVVEGEPRSMKYEVVQTNPAVGTAPTAAEGFGSSSGGALGNSNVQQFVEVVE
jgi:hypothetical protein